MSGHGYAVALVLFLVSGCTVPVAQPVIAVIADVTAGLVAVRLPTGVSAPERHSAR